MVNLKNYTRLILCLLIFVCDLTVILTLSLENHSVNRYSNETLTSNHTKPHYDGKMENIIDKPNDDDHDDNDNKDAKTSNNASDLTVAATDLKRPQLHLPVVIKPRGFHLPKNRPVQTKQAEAQQPAAQNYYSHYLSDLPPLEPDQPYYPLTEDPIIAKFLSQQNKQFQQQQQPRHQPFTPYDASILGSGDFGILRGGTFYSGEEQSYSNEEASDFYYGDASNTHTVSSTEGFIQKYTYPEEQFAQFRDFADLGTPSDSAFSQYVVVYAAKNATGERRNSKPKNIFEQLQEIDKEKALEEKKLKKNTTNTTSITKLKLVRTKLYEKKWVQKQPIKVPDDDPLIALS